MEMFKGPSGGLEIRTATGRLTSSNAENLPLYANGAECRTREHRLGYGVAQPLEAWEASDRR